ncbi:GAP family protein [Streptomyces sp. CA-251387]|uniref:GAP family protein n=1 Tax=Streptomyces sp. CA-251387 TaxID=3240064 RepID=UPI003D8D4734
MVLDLMLIGLAIAADPLPLTAFVLVLSAPRGIWNGLVFLLAWLASFVAVLAAVLLTTGGEPPAPKSPPSTASLAVRLAIGVGLVWYAEHRHRSGHRSRRRPKPSGGMMTRFDRISLWTAAGLAPLLQPWGLAAAGAATVVHADLSHTASYVALAGYCLLATSSLLAMEIYATFAPDSARARLGQLRTWMQAHQDQALIGGSLLLGLYLVGRSIYQLTS